MVRVRCRATHVDLVISLGVQPVTVPDVTGQPQATAEAAIVAATLTVGNVTSAYSDTVAAGNVISQNPIGGTSVLPGTNVDLVISLGVEPVLVPDVVNQLQATAEAAIVAASLAVGNVASAYSDTVAAGNVIGQNPIGGTSVLPGTNVDLVISLGPPSDDTKPPSRPQNHSVTLVGGLPQLTWDASTDNVGVTGYAIHRSTDGSLGPVITTVGPVTTYIDNTVVSGERYTYAVSAFDAAGNVSPNSRLRSITVPDAPPVTVPNVVGLAQAAATTAITAVGLKVGTVTQAASETVPVGNVISQNPAGGASDRTGLGGEPGDLGRCGLGDGAERGGPGTGRGGVGNQQCRPGAGGKYGVQRDGPGRQRDQSEPECWGERRAGLEREPAGLARCGAG